ncbi:hypothetical protein DCAR_0205278 [Daucus carota subsp. sativus]|uniref:Uncharacterized protein n=1 Tax=Daucus carota subsp. sativus TaxID=79200 RepID=A0AAF0WC43_DAUCS|nr:hypothetical protein DCAR_0205278 [Daucus carota subsp. sativus]
MDSTAPKKRGLGRGPTQIPRAPTNPDDRELIQLRQTPYNKRYRWADEDGPTISDLFWRKCADRTKDNLSKERTKALQNASNEFPGQGDLHMHKFNPWWCSADIWAQMCAQWTEPEFSQSQGTINWLDVYVATREGIPAAQEVARYPEGTQPPHIDQELWERASIVKKNYVKGQGQRRRPSIFGSTSLLRVLGGHLGLMDPDELAHAVAEAAASQQSDGRQVYNLFSSKLQFCY